MPASAVVQEARSRKKKRGELPKQPLRAQHGISASPETQGGTSKKEGSALLGDHLRVSLHPHNPFASQALATVRVQLLCFRMYPPMLFQLEQQCNYLGV